MIVEYEHVTRLLEDMGLTTASQILDAKLEEAARNEDISYLGFLHSLLLEEERARKIRSENTRLKLSRLPSRKTLDEFDFDFQPSIDKKLIENLSTLYFVERKENILFLGPPGVGKTHLASALGMKSIAAGKTVYFTSLAHMIEDVLKAKRSGHIDRRWKVYTRASIVLRVQVYRFGRYKNKYISDAAT